MQFEHYTNKYWAYYSITDSLQVSAISLKSHPELADTADYQNFMAQSEEQVQCLANIC